MKVMSRCCFDCIHCRQEDKYNLAYHGYSRGQLGALKLDHFKQVMGVCNSKHDGCQEDCLLHAVALHNARLHVSCEITANV